MSRALLLNASFELHSVISDRKAVCLYLEELVDVVEYSGREFHSPSTSVLVPSVCRLKKYVVMPDRHRSVLLTTRAVLARDKYECAYCGGVAETTDHIIPRALGGKHVWENVTASCRKCNQKKGNKRLETLKWTLTRVPTRPSSVSAHIAAMAPPEEWMPYLQVV